MRCYIITILAIVLFLFSTQCLSQSSITTTDPDTTLANQYLTKAKELAKKAQYDSSNFYYEKASVIYERYAIKSNNKKGWEKYVACITSLATNFQRLGKYDKTLEYLTKAEKTGLDPATIETAILNFKDDVLFLATVIDTKGTHHKINKIINTRL